MFVPEIFKIYVEKCVNVNITLGGYLKCDQTIDKVGQKKIH